MFTNETFADLGKTSMAYVKQQLAKDNATVVYAIHAADGTYLTACASRAIAAAMCLSHDMEAMSVH